MTKARSDQQLFEDFHPYDPADDIYKGAQKIVDDEIQSIKLRRPGATPQDLTGLALSGGGIRSASFSLGAMQALAKKGWLNRFDYLSTVSGGGYIGSSLTWLLHKEWDCTSPPEPPCSAKFGLDAETFPFKTEPVWSTKSTTSSATASTSTIPKNVRGSMLRWLRQNGKYLTPGGCHNFATLVAVVLRGTILSVGVYLSLLVLLFMGFDTIGLFTSPWEKINIPWALLISGGASALFITLALGYSITTFFAELPDSHQQKPTTEAEQATEDFYKKISYKRYCWRRFVECLMGMLLLGILAFAVIGLLPLIPEAFQKLFDPQLKNKITTVFGALSALAGLGSSVGVFKQSNKTKKSKWMPLLVGVSMALLALGVLLLAHQIAVPLQERLTKEGYWYIVPCVAMTMAIIGALSNLNYISLHRYYRDRLMETFMPDVAHAIGNFGNCPTISSNADHARIQDMCGGDVAPYGPYHLINTNIVLVESNIPKFKGRGGDNFILSPKYCGSNATGWRTSKQFMGGGMTLATAMAISGAAINPSAGCGGEGVTRKPILSMLMGLLNVRLGYWAPNPDPAKQPFFRAPNFIHPGLWELALRKRLNENRDFIQLSDGGHFENLGLYELIRRRLKLIVICDGGADPDFTFSDLANAIEKVRADFGALINIECKDLEPLVPRAQTTSSESDCAEKFAAQGHLIADIYYSDNSRGKLIYLTTTFTRSLSADLFGYRKEHPEFPDEPTGDQFFDEKQFEAYRELGFQLAWNMLNDAQKHSDLIT